MWPCAEKRRATEARPKPPATRVSAASRDAASRELRLLAVPFGADQMHEVNRLCSDHLCVSVPLDKELTVAEVTRLAIKDVE